MNTLRSENPKTVLNCLTLINNLWCNDELIHKVAAMSEQLNTLVVLLNRPMEAEQQEHIISQISQILDCIAKHGMLKNQLNIK